MPSRSIRAELFGLRDTLAALAGLKRAVRNKAMRPALTEASALVLARARTLAPPGETGLLRKSLTKKVKTYRQSGIVVGMVGPQTGTAAGRRVAGKRVRKLTAFGRRAQALGVQPARYAHLVELGHRLVKGGRLPRARLGRVAAALSRGAAGGGRVIGHVEAHPFLGPAWRATRGQAVEVIARRIAAELEKAKK